LGVFDQEEYKTENIYRDSWKYWMFKMSLIMVGMLSGVVLYFRKGLGIVFVILSSFMYLFVWYSTGSTASVSLMQSYALKVQLVEIHNQYGAFIYLDVLLPCFFVCLIIMLPYNLMRTGVSVLVKNKKNRGAVNVG